MVTGMGAKVSSYTRATRAAHPTNASVIEAEVDVVAVVGGGVGVRVRGPVRVEAVDELGRFERDRIRSRNSYKSWKADARTRTGDPFITSFGPLSPPVTRSQLRSLLAAESFGLEMTHGDWS